MTFDSTALSEETVPLTGGQRYRLVMLIVPCVSFLALVLLYLVFWVPIVGPPSGFFWLFIAVVLAFTGFDALRAFRDLQSGMALVTEDTIEQTFVGRRPSALRCFGSFARLGLMRMTHQTRINAANGIRHRVVYSPASKVVWSLEPLPRRGGFGIGPEPRAEQ